ncbi:MAG: hypothetical protein MRY72_04840, partial [Aquisalinus sp.]|nr:hypothetical protein [Aquisalinus sp.]
MNFSIYDEIITDIADESLNMDQASNDSIRSESPFLTVGNLPDTIIYDHNSFPSPPLELLDNQDSTLELSDIDGSNGITINGIDFYDYSGLSVSSAGDVNGDGFDDIIIGAPYAASGGQNFAGEAYVIFGNSQGLPTTLNLSDLDGSNGFLLNGITSGVSSLFGYAVSSAGDINGDGISDLIVGAQGYGSTGAYVVFGDDNGFASSINVNNLDGTDGFKVNGVSGNAFTGRSVSGAGDINGDGIDDLIIGADYASGNLEIGDSEGEAYIIFGKNTSFSETFELTALDGSNGFKMHGEKARDRLGYSVSDVGDMNGDGIDDFAISAFRADPDFKPEAGKTYVVFGNETGFDALLSLSTLDGTNGFVFNGEVREEAGRSISSAGDFNGDGISDLIIGAPEANQEAGKSYIIFGSTEGFSAELDANTLDGTNGFTINGINSRENSGFSVSSAGDFNGDGFDDLIIGAPEAAPQDTNRAGEAYLLLGAPTGFSPSFSLSDLDGTNGFILTGSDILDRAGISVSSAGDVNGDGFSDLLIGAPGGDNTAPGSGETYVIFGFSFGPINGSLGNDILQGTEEADLINGFTGNDVIFGNAGNDVIDAGSGQDEVDGGLGNDEIVGGSGNDLILGGEDDDLLMGNGGNDLLNGNDGNDHIDGGNGRDRIEGGTGDDELIGGNGGDTIFGGGGNDIISGRRGSDVIDAGAGNDFVSGRGLTDVIFGGDGDDDLRGNGGRDTLNGDAGNDRLIGGQGDDILNGGTDDDFLDGRAGNDIL